MGSDEKKLRRDEKDLRFTGFHSTLCQPIVDRERDVGNDRTDSVRTYLSSLSDERSPYSVIPSYRRPGPWPAYLLLDYNGLWSRWMECRRRMCG